MEKMLEEDQKLLNWWMSLDEIELFKKNDLIRVEYDFSGNTPRFKVYCLEKDKFKRELLVKLAIAYIQCPIEIKRLIDLESIEINDKLFEKSKFYVGQNRNYRCCELEQLLIEITNMYYNCQYDKSFICSYIDAYMSKAEAIKLKTMLLGMNKKQYYYSAPKKDWWDNMCETIFGF